MTKGLELNIKFEQAVRLMTKHFPLSDETSKKPRLFHIIRVGTYLYEQNYSDDIVIAGVLHDALEWSTITEEILRQEYGDTVVTLIKANTKDDSIMIGKNKTVELIKRCIAHSENALIIKTADILDSFKWYTSQNNENELEYCMNNAIAITSFKPDHFNDKIFNELTPWIKKDQQ